MNKQMFDIMIALSEDGYRSQRFLAEKTGYSLGLINRCMKNLADAGYLDEEIHFIGLKKNIFIKELITLLAIYIIYIYILLHGFGGNSI